MSSVVPQTPYNEYTGDGVATVYPYEFQLFTAADLVVTINEDVVPTSEFVLTGLGVQAGGAVTFNTAPMAGSDVLLSRDIVLQRDTDYQYNGQLKSDTVDNDFNRLWQALQGVSAYLFGAVRAPYPEQIPALPPASTRANTVPAFDSNGDPTVMVPASGSAADVLIQLANATDPLKADALVAVKQPTANAVERTQHEKNQDVWSAADYGALGDDSTDDTAALIKALTDVPVGATLILKGKNGDRFRTTGISIARSNITIQGLRKPKANGTNVALEGGTIIRGTFLIDGDNITLSDFGVDHGVTYSNTYKSGLGGDGLVVHSTTPPQIRRNIVVENVTGMTRLGTFADAQAAFHAVLLEGLDGGCSNNVTGVGGWFGVVLKVSNWTFDGLTGRENDTAAVYLKSNTYGPLANVVGTNVVCVAGSSRMFAGLLVQSSDAELDNVAIHGVTCIGGINPVRIEGEVAQPVVGVEISGITTRSTVNGASFRGPVYASRVSGLIDKPSSGMGLEVANNTVATAPVDVAAALRINVDGGVSGANHVNISTASTRVNLERAIVTVGYATPGNLLVTANTLIGDIFGVLSCDRTDANLVNGWTVFTGGQQAGVQVRNGVTRGYGRIKWTGSTSDTFLTLPAGATPVAAGFLIAATGFDGATSKPVPVYIAVSAAGVCSISPNRAAYATVSYLDLTSFIFPNRLPAASAF